MGKGTNRLETINQQNELLREQNKLLREQNELLRRTANTVDGRGIFVENIDSDEMRSGFLVTSHRKKLWNVQLGLVNEFARVCKKYNLRWFAFYGTLLGAARHKGFIPWDDDLDVAMLRADYEKFKLIAPMEFKPPYFVDAWQDYRREDSENAFSQDEMTLPLITRQQDRAWGYPFCYPMIKIKDSRTAMIAYPERPHVNQGIWIDVFPLDAAPPFADKKQAYRFQVARELFLAISYPDYIRESLQKEKNFAADAGDLEKFLKLSHRQKVLVFENYMLNKFSAPSHVNQLRDFVITSKAVSYRAEDFGDVVYLPFEKTEIPAPVGYDRILTTGYGDWHKPVFTHAHVLDYSANISSADYFSARSQKIFSEDISWSARVLTGSHSSI